ncbi:hypothetical protein BN1326_60262 [Staphylococcus argenteus]|uniref:Uncharacterized protein n=1 Tax=Staphylococcus argenteus TaxID=985002 RepID=A0A7U7PYB1_9STAP|nr:hypothetical protein BN1326_60262 [Staphylococcus argenteus]CRI26254.1 hypothetical protein BN1326_60262 [Staphylococcus argenteus]
MLSKPLLCHILLHVIYLTQSILRKVLMDLIHIKVTTSF